MSRTYTGGLPHGSLIFRIGFRTVKFTGGPYRNRTKNTFGVCVAKELREMPHDVHVPIPDFKTPPMKVLEDTVTEIIARAYTGQEVYIGCMGGYGRTGLFMAAIAKVLGKANPVHYVRSNYHAHAVETAEQREMVADLRSWVIRGRLAKRALRSVWQSLRHSLWG